MVTSVDDIVEELSPLGKTGIQPTMSMECPSSRSGKRANCPPEAKMSIEEALVMRNIPEGGTPIDSVTRATGYGAARVNALLVGLRLKGRIRLLPGNRVALKSE